MIDSYLKNSVDPTDILNSNHFRITSKYIEAWLRTALRELQVIWSALHCGKDADLKKEDENRRKHANLTCLIVKFISTCGFEKMKDVTIDVKFAESVPLIKSIDGTGIGWKSTCHYLLDYSMLLLSYDDHKKELMELHSLHEFDKKEIVPTKERIQIPKVIFQPVRALTGLQIEEIEVTKRFSKQDWFDLFVEGIVPVVLRNWCSYHEWSTNSVADRMAYDPSIIRRFVPIELGKAYNDTKSWGQGVIQIREYLKYLRKMSDLMSDDNSDETRGVKMAYMAQYDFVEHLNLSKDYPSLRNIILEDKDFDEIQIKRLAWLGPKTAYTPLHKDPYCNFVVQINGYKYWRFYAPKHAEGMYPFTDANDGTKLSNTSQIIEDFYLGFNPEDNAQYFKTIWPKLYNIGNDYIEAILGPGDALYFPRGWWHTVSNLTTPSFMMNHWFLNFEELIDRYEVY